MTTGRIDVHSHLLPGVDDGCADAEESIACARELVAAGYTHSFCTPHVLSSTENQSAADIARWTASLQEKLNEAGVNLSLMPGGEINLWPDLMKALSPQRLATYGEKGKYCLVDLWADKLPDFFQPTIRWLQDKGLTVILAHPERMRAVQDKPELVDEFAAMGILLQGNLQCLSDPPHTWTRRTGDRFLSQGKYFMLGSDLHKLETLPARMAGLRNAIQMAGAEIVDKLTIQNPRLLLNG